MLNLSHVSAIDAAAIPPQDCPRHAVDEPVHQGARGLAHASAVPRETQIDQANALFKKIFDDDEAWLDPRQRSAMIGAIAAVSLEMRGINAAVAVHLAGADGSLPMHDERSGARILDVVHADREGEHAVMAVTTPSVKISGRFPPVGWGELGVAGVAKALCQALTRQRSGTLAPNDFLDFEKVLRGAMRRLVEEEPEKFLRLVHRDPR